jgi:hypothetical protein
VSADHAAQRPRHCIAEVLARMVEGDHAAQCQHRFAESFPDRSVVTGVGHRAFLQVAARIPKAALAAAGDIGAIC